MVLKRRGVHDDVVDVDVGVVDHVGKAMSMVRWNVAVALVSPKGMAVHSKDP